MKRFFILFFTFLLSCGKGSDNSLNSRERAPVSDSGYFFLMNDHRVKLGLKPLTYSDNAENLAQLHSEWMGEKRSFGHTGWKERCRKLRLELDATLCGEIVARGQETAEAALSAWLNSPSHKKSIENPDWTHTGIGVSKGPDGKMYWTQMFIKIH